MTLKKKKMFSILIFLFLMYLKSYSQKLDCQKFKNGTFKLINKEAKASYIKRHEENQSEITDGNKDSTTYKVKWLNECTYTLTPTEKTHKIFSSLPANAELTVTIIETKKGSYLQTTTSNFSDMKLTNEIITIKD